MIRLAVLVISWFFVCTWSHGEGPSDVDLIVEIGTRLIELEDKVSEQETQIASLTSQLQGSTKDFIGFTAYLSQSRHNLPVGVPIVMTTTLLNEGGAYSTSTGKFTAPEDGFYTFTFAIESKNKGSAVIRLVVDGANTLDAVVEPFNTEQNLQGVNAGVLKLATGQQVWIEPYQKPTEFLEGTNTYRFTTFSGALLYRI